MQWATIDLVRKLTKTSSSDFSDLEITSFIAEAQRKVCSDLTTIIIREKVEYIDSYRSNNIDGSNTTFFMRNWLGNNLSDLNFDNEVNTKDVKVYILNTSTNTETEVVPASIDINNCSFTLSSAPVSNSIIYVTYSYIGTDPYRPNSLLSSCVAYLAGSYMFLGEDGFEVRFGNVVLKPGKDGGRGKQFHEEYKNLLFTLQISSLSSSKVGSMDEVI